MVGKNDTLASLKLFQYPLVKSSLFFLHTVSLNHNAHMGSCWRNFFFFLKVSHYLFIYLFMAVLGLRFCARAFSSCGKRGPLFIAVHGPLTSAASLVAEHRLQTRRLSNCGSRAQSLRGMWDPPRPGLEPVCPALAGRFSTTAPPGKPCWRNLESKIALQEMSSEMSSRFHMLQWPHHLFK